MNERLDKYLRYIGNTGGRISIDHFDEDWEPIGPQVRRDMSDAGLINEIDGYITRVANNGGTE